MVVWLRRTVLNLPVARSLRGETPCRWNCPNTFTVSTVKRVIKSRKQMTQTMKTTRSTQSLSAVVGCIILAAGLALAQTPASARSSASAQPQLTDKDRETGQPECCSRARNLPSPVTKLESLPRNDKACEKKHALDRRKTIPPAIQPHNLSLNSMLTQNVINRPFVSSEDDWPCVAPQMSSVYFGCIPKRIS